MTECFASENIRQVHFYKGYLYTEQSIAKGDAGMGEGAGIDNNKTDILFFGIVNMLDQLKLGIALHSGKAVSGSLRPERVRDWLMSSRVSAP